MSELQIRDYSTYTDLLPVQFKDSENLIELLNIYLDQVQELNEAQLNMGIFSTDIDTAQGYQLDLIGKLLGAEREGRSDAAYRDYIRYRISINIGSGTPEDVIGFLQTITKSNTVRYWEHYPACTVLETHGENIPYNLTSTLDNVTPAGVRTGGVIVVEDNTCFRPCNLKDAYSNGVPILPEDYAVAIDFGDPSAECGGASIECIPAFYPQVFYMGEEDGYLGNPLMEMNGSGLLGYNFLPRPPNTLFGNSILPNMKEAYEMVEGIWVVKDNFKQGRLVNILSDKNN